MDITCFAEEKNNTVRIIKEATFVGVVTVIVGYIASILLKPYFGVSLPDICKTWNKKHVMEISLFMTGFVLHIIMEKTGINKKYATYRSLLN